MPPTKQQQQEHMGGDELHTSSWPQPIELSSAGTRLLPGGAKETINKLICEWVRDVWSREREEDSILKAS